MMGEFVVVRRKKKKMSFFFSFLITKKTKRTVRRPWHSSCGFLFLFLFLFCFFAFSSVQFSLVAQSCPTLCDPMIRSTPGLPVHHKLLEFTQTHAPRVGDAIQSSRPPLSPSPPAPNSSKHQCSHMSSLANKIQAKVLYVLCMISNLLFLSVLITGSVLVGVSS